MATHQVGALSDFFGLMASQPERVTYGFRHVAHACEQHAIEKLLLTDDLFRAQTVARRTQYVSLVEQARDAGAAVHIFSSLHVSGEQLSRLSGVAAILRFPMPIDDMLYREDNDSSDSDEAQAGQQPAQ